MKDYWPDNNNNQKCLSSCPTEDTYNINNQKYRFHKNDDNECMLGENCHSIENNDYKYSIKDIEEDQVVICYKSCKEIPGDLKYVVDDYYCSNECGNEGDYYYENNGIIKCVKANNFPNECISAGFFYLKGKECVKDCDSNQYKIPYKLDNGKIIDLGECVDEPPFGETNCNYYSINKQICYDECPYRIVKNGENEEVSIEGNCVIDCPSDFPYEYEDNNGKYCLKECEKFYLVSSSSKKCVEDCKTYSKFFFKDDHQCYDKCQKKNNNEINNYYYNENNECLTSCAAQTENDAFKYALKIGTSPQKCLQECPNESKYYYDDDKICLSNCNYNGINGFIKEEGKYECVPRCDFSDGKNYIIKGNICSNNCTVDEPFFYEISSGATTIKKCTSNCIKENSILKFYVYDETTKLYKCLSSCVTGQKEYGNECLTGCPKGLFEESNKCISKCNNKPYYNNNGVYICTDRCSGGKEYMTSYNECVENCPQFENYIGSGKKCKTSCENPLIDGEYYRKKTVTGLDYPIYECTKECIKEGDDKEMIVEGIKECVKECPKEKPYYSLYDNTCYDLCLKNPGVPFSIIEESGSPATKTYKCDIQCQDEQVYYERNKICKEDCDTNDLINDEDNSCVNKCDFNSLYKYQKKKADGKLHCVDLCNKYTAHDYYCYDEENDGFCPESYKYIIGKECHEKCNSNQYANPKDENDPPKEYICKSSCNYGLYYDEEDKICQKECKSGYYNIEYQFVCVKSCSDLKYYIYEPNGNENSKFQRNTCVTDCPSDKPFKDIDFKCKEECEFEGFKYYTPEEKKCSNICNGYKNGTICLQKCPSNVNIYSDENKNCVDSCQKSLAGYYFYYKTNFQCIQKCKQEDFIFGNECVSKCPEGNIYIYNGECVPNCKLDKNFYIDNFDENKLCLSDCSSEYPFYTIDENGAYKCSSSCPENEYYKTNKDPNIIAKECIPTCESDDYKYYFKHNNTHKECFENCPSQKADFYVESEEQNYKYECFDECPSHHPYHERNSFECLKSCESNFANYNKKMCVSNCGKDSFWIKVNTIDEKEMTLCVNDCNEVDYGFYTPDKECVPNCDASKSLKGNQVKKKM